MRNSESNPPYNTRHQQRVHGLDIARSIAILAVILYHLPKTGSQHVLRAISHFGWAGVDLFFVLSGYLIGGTLLKELDRPSALSFKTYFGRRFLRTLPNYFVVLAVSAWILPHLRDGVVRPDWRYLFFLQNFSFPVAFNQSWSLCVEEHFYVVFPFIIFALHKARLSQSKIFLLFIAILLTQPILRALIWLNLRPDLIAETSVDAAFQALLTSIHYPTFCRLDGLCIGVGLAAIQCFRPTTWQTLIKQGNRYLLALPLVGTFTLLILLNRVSFVYSTFGYLALSLTNAILILSLISPHCILSKVYIPGAHIISVWSYALYLTHAEAMGLSHSIATSLGFTGTDLFSYIITLFVVLTVAAILYYGIETPFLALRDRNFKHSEGQKL